MDEGRGVYEVLRADTSPFLFGLVFSNKDKAAGVSDLLVVVLRFFDLLDLLVASLVRFAIIFSASFAADSRWLFSAIRNGEGASSRPDKTMGVPSMVPHVVMGDSFPVPGTIWGVMATYGRDCFCF